MAPNMGYCRFENTLGALRECMDYWDDPQSEEEQKAKAKLINLCREIADDFTEGE